MRKLIPSVFAALLITPLIVGSADAQFRQFGGRGPAGAPSNSNNGPRAGGAVSGGGPGGGGFIGRPGGTFRGGTGGTFNGGGDWRFRRRNFGVVFVDPWYDPFWPYGYGFGWGYGWYGPPYYTERRVVTEYAEPPVDYGPPPEQFWYYCGDPDGYYPYVQSCNREWQPVPVTPPGGPPGPQAAPPPRASQSGGSRSDGG